MPVESPEAIARVGGGKAVEKRLLHILRTEFDRPGVGGLAQFNDGCFTEHAEVLDLLSRAARRDVVAASAAG